MALSNIDKEHLDNLLISINDKHNDNKIDFIKNNHVNYGKLKMIIWQINMLKNEAKNIILDAQSQNNIHNIKKNFKLTSGNYYYIYEKTNLEQYMSLISPSEWQNTDTFIGKYYYDYDKQFILQKN